MAYLLQEKVYSYRNISEADRFALMFAFSGSRELPLLWGRRFVERTAFPR